MSIPTAAAATAHTTNSRHAKLVLGALGVVYGDIGTSPIYTLRECLLRVGSEMPVQEAVLGVLSLMFWAKAASCPCSPLPSAPWRTGRGPPLLPC